MKDLEALRDALDVALLRLESGQALARSLDDAPRFACDRVWVERWVELRRRLLSGHVSAVEAIGNFRRSVDLQLRVRRLVAKRSLLPLAQAASVGVTSLLFLGVTQVFFSESFRLRAPELGLALGLILGGWAWIWRLVNAYRKDLWFLDWLEFVSALSTQLSWGQGLLAAWKNAQPAPGKLPAPLEVFLATSLHHAENYQALPPAVACEQAPLVLRCRTRWEQVHRLFVANERVLPLLQKEIDGAFAGFQETLERQADLLAMRLLLPLFLCFAPAYLVMLLVPLIRPWAQPGL
jgi:hypothetical protein